MANRFMNLELQSEVHKLKAQVNIRWKENDTSEPDRFYWQVIVLCVMYNAKV